MKKQKKKQKLKRNFTLTMDDVMNDEVVSSVIKKLSLEEIIEMTISDKHIEAVKHIFSNELTKTKEEAGCNSIW